MKSGLRIAVSLALCLALLVPVSPVSACCEDGDFWCWLGVVVTGGISCAVQNLINSINDLIRDVKTLASTVSGDIATIKSAGVGGVKLAKDELKAIEQAMKQEYEDARKRAQEAKETADQVEKQTSLPGGSGGGAGGLAAAETKITAPPGTLPTPSSKDAQASLDLVAMKQAMKDGEQQVSEQQSLVGQQVEEVMAQAENAHSQASSAADAAGKIATDALLAPLTDLAAMLGDLVTHPDRLFDPAALVDDQIKRVTGEIDSELGKVADAIVLAARPSLDKAGQKTQDTSDVSSAAKAIADQMQQLARSRTKADLDKLKALLPPQGKTLVQHFSGPGLAQGLVSGRARVTNALLKTGAGKSKSTEVASARNSKLKTSWSGLQMKQQAVLHPVPVPGAQAAFQQKFEAMFKGLTKAQADAKKNELLAEARRRFGNDAKTLSQSQNLINLQAQKSLPGGVLPAVSR